jgi:hypothetical protein
LLSAYWPATSGARGVHVRRPQPRQSSILRGLHPTLHTLVGGGRSSWSSRAPSATAADLLLARAPLALPAVVGVYSRHLWAAAADLLRHRSLHPRPEQGQGDPTPVWRSGCRRSRFAPPSPFITGGGVQHQRRRPHPPRPACKPPVVHEQIEVGSHGFTPVSSRSRSPRAAAIRCPYLWGPCPPRRLCPSSSTPVATSSGPPVRPSPACSARASPRCRAGTPRHSRRRRTPDASPASRRAALSFVLPSDLCDAAGCPLEDIETGSRDALAHPCPPLYDAYDDGSLVAHLRRVHRAGCMRGRGDDEAGRGSVARRASRGGEQGAR